MVNYSIYGRNLANDSKYILLGHGKIIDQHRWETMGRHSITYETPQQLQPKDYSPHISAIYN